MNMKSTIRQVLCAVVFLLIAIGFAILLYLAIGGGAAARRVEATVRSESCETRSLVDARADAIEARLDAVDAKLDRIEGKLDLLIKMATPVLPDGMKASDRP